MPANLTRENDTVPADSQIWWYMFVEMIVKDVKCFESCLCLATDRKRQQGYRWSVSPREMHQIRDCMTGRGN
jgi:hypothetical protein